MTRAGVLQLGLGVFLLGAVAYGLFRLLGLEGFSAGIASEALLVAIVLLWTVSYLFRVVTGQMTFMEQRKRYRKAYEKITEEELQNRYDSLSEEDKLKLIKEIEMEKK